jgi:transposase
MHIDVVPNRNSAPCVLLRETFRENGKVKHRTLKNLSDFPPDRIMAIKRALQGEYDHVAFSAPGADGTEQGNRFGAIYVAYQIAKQIGLLEVLGKDRKGKLALLMVLAQLISPMSKRAIVKWAENEAVHEVLGLGAPEGVDFDEDDLYEALDDLADRRHQIELRLFKLRNKDCSRLFLYDVTSSYLEGDCNELADWGYNRDGKKGKKQIVIGLLTDEDGDPVAVEVFQGNTSDPGTVLDQINTLSERFGVREIVFVGDRGMVKSIPMQAIKEVDFRYITAITKPQVKKLINDGVLQLSWIDESLAEVEHEGVRYVFRRNPIRAIELDDSRQARIGKVRHIGRVLSDRLAESERRRPDAALRTVNEKIEKLKLAGFVSARLDDRRVCVEVDEDALAQKAALDGVYVLKTDTGPEQLDKEAVHKAYKSLYQVECDFRAMKTELEVRPVYVRKESRTRGHVLMVMLALILRRELEHRLKSIDAEVRHAIAVLDGWTLLKESLGGIRFNRLPKPKPQQQQILAALGLAQPTFLEAPRKRGRRKKE